MFDIYLLSRMFRQISIKKQDPQTTRKFYQRRANPPSKAAVKCTNSINGCAISVQIETGDLRGDKPHKPRHRKSPAWHASNTNRRHKLWGRGPSKVRLSFALCLHLRFTRFSLGNDVVLTYSIEAVRRAIVRPLCFDSD